MAEKSLLDRSLSAWEEELAHFRVANRENKIRRHCRISVVTPKNPIDGSLMLNRRLVWFERSLCQS